MRLVQYTSPDHFATEPEILYFWYEDNGHLCRVAVHPSFLPPKDSPDQLAGVRELARRAFRGAA